MSTPIETSHPWIDFQINLSRASSQFWMLLGEARSKCRHLCDVPLKPKIAKELHELYLAKGVHATTAIEGNSLSESQVRLRQEGKLSLPGSQEYLETEIDNATDAINWVAHSVLEGRNPFLSIEEILEVNRLVLDGLEVEEPTVPGALRQHQVGVANYGAPHSDHVRELTERMVNWLNSPEFFPKDDTRIPLGIIRAVLVHLYIAWIHPFGDGNGRTARALEFKCLLAAGAPTPAAHVFSNHYNKTRQQYYRQLQRASENREDGLISFLHYAVKGFVEGLKEQLDLVWSQQYDIAWESYVHEKFRGSNKPKDRRQRALVFGLTALGDSAPLSKLRRLNANVAELYAKTSEVTIYRDLDELIEMGLVKKLSGGYSVNKELILAFRPPSFDNQVSDNQMSLFEE